MGGPSTPTPPLPGLSPAEQTELSEARRYVAEAAELILEDQEEAQREGRPFDAVGQMEIILEGLDEWKVAALIRSGDLHALPPFVREAMRRDTRSEVVEALRKDEAGPESVGALIERHRARLQRWGLSDRQAVREHAQADGVRLYRMAHERIGAGQRGALDEHEVELGAFLARGTPTREAIDVFMSFAAGEPQIATALLNNAFLIKDVELLRGVVGGLLRSLEGKNGKLGEWAYFLLAAYKAVAVHPQFMDLNRTIIAFAQKSPQAAEIFVEDEEIPDDVVRLILSIEVARRNCHDATWYPVFGALRRHRYDLSRSGTPLYRELSRNVRVKAVLDNPFRTS